MPAATPDPTHVLVMLNEDGAPYVAYPITTTFEAASRTGERLAAADEFAYSFDVVDLRPLPDVLETAEETLDKVRAILHDQLVDHQKVVQLIDLLA